jgi:excisionase family DNA binding protein
MHDLLTPLEAAEVLGLGRPRVYQLAREGSLETHTDGHFIFVTRASVEAWRERPIRSRQAAVAAAVERARERVALRLAQDIR